MLRLYLCLLIHGEAAQQGPDSQRGFMLRLCVLGDPFSERPQIPTSFDLFKTTLHFDFVWQAESR